jgi:hypothetical protein
MLYAANDPEDWVGKAAEVVEAKSLKNARRLSIRHQGDCM